MTADELFALQPQLNGMAHELDSGILKLYESAGAEHGDIWLELAVRLRTYVRQHRLGSVLGADVGFIIERNPDTVLAPDVAFIRSERISKQGIPQGYFEGAPDLAVEVMSPRDRFPDLERKVKKYLRAGTTLVWVIRPRDQIAIVYCASKNPVTIRKNEVLEGSSVVPGFCCELEELFVR